LPGIPAGAWAVGFRPVSGAPVAGLRGRDAKFGSSTGVVEAGDRLWLGCIGASAVAYTVL
jgi:hypothetical protein